MHRVGGGEGGADQGNQGGQRDRCEHPEALGHAQVAEPAAVARPWARMFQVMRPASLADISTLISAPARATINQRFGCAEPNSANTVVKITGSGFQLEPPVDAHSWPWSDLAAPDQP